MISYTIVESKDNVIMSLSEETSISLDSEDNCAIDKEIRCEVLMLVASMGQSVVVETYQGIEIKRLSLGF